MATNDTYDALIIGSGAALIELATRHPPAARRPVGLDVSHKAAYAPNPPRRSINLRISMAT